MASPTPRLTAVEATDLLAKLGRLAQPPAGVSAPIAREAERRTTSSNEAGGGPPAVATRPLPVWDQAALVAVLESVPDAVVAADDAGPIVLVNQQAEALFGYPRGELLGRPVEILMPERYRGRHVGQRQQFCADPRIRPMGANLDLWGRRRDGHEFPVEISLSPLRTAAGLLVTTTVRDISRRRQAEQQLRHAEARYRTLVEEIPAVTFMAALDESAAALSELYVSPQIESLLGFTQRQWLEDPVLWYTQLHPDDRDRWHVDFARTVATAEPFDAVYRFISRDGRVVWVHGHAKVVRDHEGRPLFLQGVAFDITERKRAEEALSQLNKTLERSVAEVVDEDETRLGGLAR